MSCGVGSDESIESWLKRWHSKSKLTGGLCALKAEAKLYIDANVWDGEDRSGAVNDKAHFNPDDLQELIDDLLEHLST